MKIEKTINILNKRAKFEYEILEQIEAGIVLTGTEIKALRSSKASITESFCQFIENELFVVNMSIDEYETIRLIDLAGFTQEKCANQMAIARTTVQAIYNEARQKIAKSLVHGYVLIIEGGDYKLCDGLEHSCECGGCGRH